MMLAGRGVSERGPTEIHFPVRAETAARSGSARLGTGRDSGYSYFQHDLEGIFAPRGLERRRLCLWRSSSFVGLPSVGLPHKGKSAAFCSRTEDSSPPYSPIRHRIPRYFSGSMETSSLLGDIGRGIFRLVRPRRRLFPISRHGNSSSPPCSSDISSLMPA